MEGTADSQTPRFFISGWRSRSRQPVLCFQVVYCPNTEEHEQWACLSLTMLLKCSHALDIILRYASPDTINQGPSSCCIERHIPIIGISGCSLVGRHRPQRLPSGLVESKLKTCMHRQTLDSALTKYYISLGLSLVLRPLQEFQLPLQQAKTQNLQ